ncbi:N-acetylglucosamine kinase [Paenibacillus sp. TRM 82003]|nr:N-acetylglucosamine kinase [Paenibacillus sp. TRM 82003]
MFYYIGVDGGGTKTELSAALPEGRTIHRVSGASTNPHAVGREAAVGEFVRLLEHALTLLKDRGFTPAGLCLGLSGVASFEEERPFAEALVALQRSLDLHFPYDFLSEAEISLMAAINRPYGVLVVSGTGSIAYGVGPDGSRCRSGGWGHLLGDEGSGYAIGQRALKAAMASYDGAGPETALVPMIIESYRFSSITDLKPYIYAPGIAKSDIAAFAKLCLQACAAGDAVASGIVRSEAEALAGTTAALLRRAPALASADAVCAGSIFLASDAFSSTFRETLAASFPALRFPDARTDRSPADGGAAMARLLYDQDK